MGPDERTCWGAVVTRDARFDGLFFVGVRTTGIYCRPVCAARTPRRERCSFFRLAAEAERAGFRACFRCRPELAPGCAPVDSVPRLVARALARIESGYLNDHSVDSLARELAVTPRHLRRAMDERLGIGPVELAQSRRIALAKQLLQDTSLGLADVAFASGFRSVRRFNALFLERFGRAPSEVRRRYAAPDTAPGVSLRLDYRPPLDWRALLGFLGARAIPGVERVDGDEYSRVLRIGESTGTIRVRPDARRAALRADVSLPLTGSLMEVVARLRALFDLDARPDAVARDLSRDGALARLVARHPGLRVPGSADPFETIVRAVLGQQVSVRTATTLAGRIATRFGREVPAARSVGLTHRFPSARELGRARAEEVAAIGLPLARARALLAIAGAFARRTAPLVTAGASADELTRTLVSLPGVGPWTAQYAAMRVLHHPDAFPASDLGTRKALGRISAAAATARAERWRPWRSYAVMYLWTSLAEGDSR